MSSGARLLSHLMEWMSAHVSKYPNYETLYDELDNLDGSVSLRNLMSRMAS